MPPIFHNQKSAMAKQDGMFKTQLSMEEIKLMNNEKAFFSAFGFAGSLDVRKMMLLTKNQLSMSIEDVKKIYKAGFIKLDPVGENKVSLILPSYKVILYALEILISVLLYFWPIVLFSGLMSTQSNLFKLVVVVTIALIGFFLAYFQYQRNIQPILILKRHGFSIGDQYVLPTP